MTELPDPDDATFRLATGEELVLPGDATPEFPDTPDHADADDRPASPDGAAVAPIAPAAPIAPGARVPRPSYRDRRVARRLRARKVRRLVRHVEPWSVLKISLLFYFCIWGIMLIAGVILWSFAVTSGTIDNVENFIRELFALESFEFNADEIFRASAIGGLVLVVAGAGFTVLLSVLFNLISDVTGGIRFTVVEEETARPRPKRTRPRGGVRRAVPVAVPSPGPGEVGSPPSALPVAQPAEVPSEDEIPLLPTADRAVATAPDAEPVPADPVDPAGAEA